MKIYVDPVDFKCHTTNPDGTFQEVEHEFFNNKCPTFIEGFCYDDSRGHVRIYPWKDYTLLDAAQREYERQQIAEYEKALAEIEAALGV